MVIFRKKHSSDMYTHVQVLTFKIESTSMNTLQYIYNMYTYYITTDQFKVIWEKSYFSPILFI